MHRSRAPSIAPGTFFVAQSWADCITNMAGFNLRNAQRPFLERNKDQLLLLLIGGIVGGLITFAGVVAKERFYPSAPTVNATKPP